MSKPTAHRIAHSEARENALAARAIPGAVAEAARMLVAAEDPGHHGCGRAARTPAGLKLLVELAELLQALRCGTSRFRMNFPSSHPLYGGGNLATADVIMALEVPDFWMSTHAMTPVNKMGMESRSITQAGR